MNVTDHYARDNGMTLSSIASFASVAGRQRDEYRDGIFMRGIGCNASYVADIAQMDALLQERQMQRQGGYLRVGELPKLCLPEDVFTFRNVYGGWKQNPAATPQLAVAEQNVMLGTVLSRALCKVSELFRLHCVGATETMETNLMVKILFWIKQALEPLLLHWCAELPGKFVYTGPIKRPEYLLCYLLTLLGIDVLILSPAGPPDLEAALLALSSAVHLGAVGEVCIPAYPVNDAKTGVSETTVSSNRNGVSKNKVDIRRPDRERVRAPLVIVAASRQELAFEQLALLASSVVMIEVVGPDGQVLAGGSGIMVGESGYILTNHHVASKGSCFSVHIEEDEVVYHTDELIKTHALLDLALIRIQRKLRPIPVYQQAAPLVRGQKVVAIGSPLGLFNSVSDGIISGFRTIDAVPMIQFTAPISHGSSGGALLNLYGEIIGISTAGIDRGQNLNLAVGYQNIQPFIKGFLR